MMNETVRFERTQIVMPDFEEQKKLTEDCSQGQVREQEITEIREIHSREDIRDAKLRKRISQGRRRRRRSQRMNLDETNRAPSLFTWRY
ncbi:MAG: hypothetical protein IIA05_11480 [Proteobacteria bacterium]|nr:hypothetical protein [Pseudomonadota bacterium]